MLEIKVRASRFANDELFPVATVYDSDSLPSFRTLRYVQHLLRNAL